MTSAATQYNLLAVLGGGFRARGELSRNSLARTRIAIELYRQVPRPILFSGGKTRRDTDQSEAEAMAALAAAQGVASEHLLLETRSQNTWENALFCAPLLKDHVGRNVLLITSPYHMRRALLCFRAHGIQLVEYSGPFPQELITTKAIVGEYAAFLRTWLRLQLK
jgi:uncharacterized SAM-binding protein YcdF (DUF218 family)